MTDSKEDFVFSLFDSNIQKGCPCCFPSGDRQQFGSTLH